MKKCTFFISMIFTILLALQTEIVSAQEENQQLKTRDKLFEEEEDTPKVFKFEPGFLLTNQRRTAEIDEARKTIDTMKISDRKRYRLLKKLYKNAGSQPAKKELLADVKFEDIEE